MKLDHWYVLGAIEVSSKFVLNFIKISEQLKSFIEICAEFHQNLAPTNIFDVLSVIGSF